MKKNPPPLPKKEELRKKAENKLNSAMAGLEDVSEIKKKNINVLVHELQVHQIELEMQNEEIRQAQIQIEQSQEKYFDLYNFAPVGFIQIDRKGTILDLNTTAAEMLDSNKESIVKTLLYHHVEMSHRDLFYLHLAKVAETNIKQSCEIKMIKKDKSVFDVQLICVPEPDETIESISYKIAIWDVSEQKQAKEALLENQKHYQSLFESSPIPLWEEDFSEVKKYIDSLKKHRVKDFRKYFKRNPQKVQECARLIKITDVNQSVLNLHEANSKEDLIQGLSTIFTENSYNALQEELIAIAEGKTNYEFEGSVKTLNGEERQIHLKWMVVPGYEETLKKIFLSTTDITGRKQAEILLRESEAFKETLLNNSSDIIYIYDLVEKKNIYSNDRILKILGYTVEEVQEMGEKIIPILMHPTDLETYIQEIIPKYDTLKDNDLLEHEYRMKHKDGTWYWLRSRESIYLRTEEGTPVQIFGMVTDITDRIKAENDIKAYTTFLDSSMEHSPFAMWVADTSGTIIRTNKVLRDTLHLTNEQMLGKYNVLKDQNLEKQDVMHLVQKVFSDGQPARFEIKWSGDATGKDMYADAASIWIDVSMYPVQDENGRLKNVICQWIDVTERKQMFEELQNRNKYIETIVENLPIGFALNTIDDGAVKYINKGFEDIYGWSKEVLTNVNIFFDKVFPDPDFRNEMSQKIISDMQSGDPERMRWNDLKIVTEAGETRYVYAHNIPLFDQNLMMSTVQDVTKRKLAEDEIKKHQEHLEEMVKERTSKLEESQKALIYLLEDVNASRDELEIANANYENINKELEAFAYSVSHDLRAPLRQIQGFAEIINMNMSDNLPVKGKRYLNNISEAANYMGDLIDGLLIYSRTGRSELNKVPLSLNLVVNKFIEDYQQSLDAGTRIQWIVHEIPEVKADRMMMEQVVMNLLTNAIKFTRKEEKPVIEVGSIVKEGETVFFVKDNGVGFNMDYVDKIFGVFQRLHSQEIFEGTGIGLANVQRIILRHGGRIWAEGEEGKGASFYYTLPQSNKNEKNYMEK